MDRSVATRAATVSAADLVAVALGGAFGTLLRVGGLELGAGWRSGMAAGESPGFLMSALLSPTGITLLENLTGAAALGLFLGVLLGSRRISEAVPHRFKLLLLTGVLGSFTTFSALALDGAILMGVEPAALPIVGHDAPPRSGTWPEERGTEGEAGSVPWGGLLLLGLSAGGGLVAALAGLRTGRSLGVWWEARGRAGDSP